MEKTPTTAKGDQPAVRKLILNGDRFTIPFTAGIKLATRLIPTVAAKQVIAPIMPSITLSVRPTILVGLVIASPQATAAPAVVSKASAENGIIFNGKPARLLISALREAVKGTEVTGLRSVIPKRGIIVMDAGPETTRDCLSLRAMFDCERARCLIAAGADMP